MYEGSTVTRVQLPAGTKPAETVLTDAFQLLGCERWGGASQNGWSKMSDFLRCPYRYYLKHVVQAGSSLVALSSLAQDIGAYTHAVLAAYYAAMLPDARYPGFRASCPTPDRVIEALVQCGASTTAMVEVVRLWDVYIDHYGYDAWYPMGVEVPVGDPKIHTSRYDLVVDVRDGLHDGLWIGEHKTLSPRSDIETYRLDGEILGECLSWRLSNLDAVFGPLEGVCLNVLFKGSTVRYQRIWIPVVWSLIDEFAQSRAFWQSARDTMIANGRFPKNLYGCVARFDRCLFWDHCETLSSGYLLMKGESGND